MRRDDGGSRRSTPDNSVRWQRVVERTGKRPCEAVDAYNGNGPAVWAPITDGVIGAIHRVTESEGLEAIACPTLTTCLAVGEANGFGGLVVITNDRAAPFGVLPPSTTRRLFRAPRRASVRLRATQLEVSGSLKRSSRCIKAGSVLRESWRAARPAPRWCALEIAKRLRSTYTSVRADPWEIDMISPARGSSRIRRVATVAAFV